MHLACSFYFASSDTCQLCFKNITHTDTHTHIFYISNILKKQEIPYSKWNTMNQFALENFKMNTSVRVFNS